MYNENLSSYLCNQEINPKTKKVEITGTIKPYDLCACGTNVINKLLNNPEMNKLYKELCDRNPSWVERAKNEDVMYIVNYAKPSPFPQKLSMRISCVGPGCGVPTISFDNYK